MMNAEQARNRLNGAIGGDEPVDLPSHLDTLKRVHNSLPMLPLHSARDTHMFPQPAQVTRL